MTKYILIICMLFASISGACADNLTSPPVSIVPRPVQVVPGEGNFTFSARTLFSVENHEQAVIVRNFINLFKRSSGITPQLAIGSSEKSHVRFTTDSSLKSEAYQLEITPEQIQVKASDIKGFFYALQTIRLLLPSAVEGNRRVENIQWSIPAVTIQDEPRFGYRALMLDAARFFIPKENVLRIIDCMGMLKINTLHFHLTDDNGWRVEIKKYPRLTEVGAMHHLPALLEIEELNAIQWTPGVGEPQGGSPKWYDLYKKILAGGKSVMACWVTLDELKPLLDHIGADGVHLEMDFHNEKEVEQAMRIVEEYTGSSTSVNTNEHQQDADLATTGQERICIREEQHQQEDKLKPLYEAIVAGKLEPAVEITRQAIAEGIAPQMIINNYMIKAMGEVGQRFQDGKAFVPQLLMAGRAMKGALELLKPLLAGSASTTIGKIVIGTVKGDLHDIGKNLVASMLEGCGFEVINIGIDVTCDKFVEAVKENHADILCMSALLTTTMTYMKEVIQALEEAGIRNQVKVMIGGAPVSQGFADEIGADGYSDNANTAVAVAKELIGNKK